jgi:hypothetical protein
MTITTSAARIARLSLLTALFALACGLPDSLHTVVDAIRMLTLDS